MYVYIYIYVAQKNKKKYIYGADKKTWDSVSLNWQFNSWKPLMTDYSLLFISLAIPTKFSLKALRYELY